MRSTCLLLILAATACTGRAPVEPQVSALLGDTFVLRVGQQVSFDQESLRITFDAVVEDSRCPLEVNCVWEGNARVRLRVIAGDSSAVVDLNTSDSPANPDPAPRAAVVFGYRISLERLEPHPIVPERMPQDRYRAFLRVTKS